MWARIRLRIGWGDLLAGIAFCLVPPDRESKSRAVEGYLSPAGDTIAAYSVRSGFDLLIQALGLERGDEVILSALNVKGMVRIVHDAGLVPVPVDLDIGHMGPSLRGLERAITPRSRIFIAAHLFGARLDLDPLFSFARARGLISVEDCAQAFNGRTYPGSAEADINLFSFGPIKTATALGGALIRVKNSVLRDRMCSIQATYPVQANAKQLKRCLQFIALKVATARPVLAAIHRYYHSRGKDYESALADRVRDVAPLKTAKNLRMRPSAGMLALLNRRLQRFDLSTIEKRTKKGEFLRDLLGKSVLMPAQANHHHDYWVFPLLVSQPRQFIDGLRAEGFDASDLPRSQHIAAPANRPDIEPHVAADVMRRLIVVPCYEDMPDSALRREAEVIKRIATSIPEKRCFAD